MLKICCMSLEKKAALTLATEPRLIMAASMNLQLDLAQTEEKEDEQ